MNGFRQLPEGARVAIVALITVVISLAVIVPITLRATGRWPASPPVQTTTLPPPVTGQAQPEPVKAHTPNPARYSFDSARPTPVGVAENGSHYGEISATTGRPKTVYVNGYFRKDGTYVRGHYRSKPRR